MFALFKKYLTYYRYQQSIRKWAASVGYTEKDIDWIFHWTDITTTKSHRDLVVVFARELMIRGYTEIFNIYDLRILEKTPEDDRKVRFGIPKQLHQELLTYVRSVATAHLKGTALPEIKDVISETFHSYLEDSFTVDVGVWVDGVMRGSHVFNNDAHINAILGATLLSLRDERLKPIMLTEIDRATFEITIVPNIWVRLDEENSLTREAPYFYATKCMQANTVKGFYMPIIANHTAYANLYEYLAGLWKKSQLPHPKDVTFMIAPAFSAVESETRGETMILRGPYPAKRDTTVSTHTIEVIRDNLMHAVDPAGFLPIVRRAKGDVSMALDLSRIGFVFYALCEYYALTDDERVRSSLRLIDSFLRYATNGLKDGNETTMVKVYCNQAATYVPDLLSHTTFTERELTETNQSPLRKVQYVRQLIMRTDIKPDEALKAFNAVQTLYKEWQQEPEQFKCPVQYADLLWLLEYSKLHVEADIFADWLRSLQLPDGSFTARRSPQKAYTRGTGKVAEAAASIERTQDITKRALHYIRQMQYSDATMYHIPLHLRNSFRGGFRHDAWNRDLWLDGSAHVLLAELRLLYAAAYKDHLQRCLSAYRSALPKQDS